MVKALSDLAKQAIGAAITEAERSTSAEIVVVAAPFSDVYMGYITLYALIAGSLLTTVLWGEQIITYYPKLLLIQISIVMLFTLLAPLRACCVKLVPGNIRQHRAAQKAYTEYLSACRYVPASVPLLLFYVSLAERYAHILPSRIILEKIPEAAWVAVIDRFKQDAKKGDMEVACIETVRRIQQLLTPHFPFSGEAHFISDEVV